MIRWRFCTVLLFLLSIGGCASGPDAPPYPAFVVSAELPDVFMASLPGVRAKQFAGDAQTRVTSNRVDLPTGWSGTTGGSPGQDLELFVLAGRVQLADITLEQGGYAFLPSGSLGFNLRADDGARVLYFRNNSNESATIRSPIIVDSGLLDWEATDRIGVLSKDLRADPGSGARTWLMRIEPGAQLPWQSESVRREGYLVAGQFRDSECVDGEAFTEVYLPGGYFYRPAGAVSGGPEAAAITESLWFMRETAASQTSAGTCVANN